MIKDITIVKNGLVIEVGSLEKSHIEGWVAIYSKKREHIGGFSLLDNKLKVLHKNKLDDSIYLIYSIIDREVK